MTHVSTLAKLLALCTALFVAGCSDGGRETQDTTTPSGPAATATPSASATASPSGASPSGVIPSGAPTDLVTGLDVPWAIAFLPDGDALVTLRDKAEVIRVSPEGSAVTVGSVPGVDASGEGGLLGIAVSPTFATDQSVHLYFTAGGDNRIVRTNLGTDGFGPMTTVLTGIPKAGNHNGGRIAWGPDGFLYVGTGDAARTERAQDRTNLGGKILRITADGKPAPGNPFAGSPVWSLGHRNVQGLAWGADGTMFASEFGQNTWDELNVIVAGKNYGWPEVEGIEDRDGFVAPIAQWSTDDSSPSGIAVGADGAVYLAALRGESIWKVNVDGAQRRGDPIRLLESEYGRIRDVVRAPDGTVWALSNNTFRGQPRSGDDRVLRVPLG